MKRFVSLILVFFPWPVRRWMLGAFFGYKIHPTAKIGFSLVCPDRLEMGANSQIGSLNICKGLSLLKLDENAIIGTLNWITGMPIQEKRYFTHEKDRRPELVVGPHAAITTRHYIDCTNAVHVGKFATVAGLGSQFLTHSIDIGKNKQSSKPIRVGDYCLVGSGCILLGGSVLPNHSVVSAGTLLNKVYTKDHYLYGGVPARALLALPDDLGYFVRTTGFVN